MDTIITILQYVVLPSVTGVVSWFAGRSARKSDALRRMQDSVDLLITKNSELVKDVTALRAENMQLKASVDMLTSENKELKRSVEAMQKRLVASERVK